MKKLPKISIIIAVEEMNGYLDQCLKNCAKLDYPDFEILVFISKDPKKDYPKTKFVVNQNLAGQPAKKRDQALEHANGEILAFIDDDAYPKKDWLKKAVGHFEKEEVAGVSGPGVTPKEDGIFQKVGGWVWSTWIGSGGAGTYRCLPQEIRFVDDYPTFNLLVRKKDFQEVGGFDSKYWPGEDTKLCHDLCHRANKKIVYDPKVVVYHHRRPIFEKHLLQLGRYGLHRGFFAKKLPKTSLRLGYFIPSLFTLFFLSGLPISIAYWSAGNKFWWLALMGYLYIMLTYLIVVSAFALKVFIKEKNILVALLFIPAVFATHLEYGIQFIRGLTGKDLKK